MILFIALLLMAVLGICLYCYRIAFYAPPGKPMPEDDIPLPKGPVYEPFHPQMTAWVHQIRAMNREYCEIKSFDGLRLTGYYYEYRPGAPMEIMFHGYRGSAEQDLPGGVQRAFSCGRSALIVDQRCAGGSQGKTITFGVNERKDCLAWVDFAVKRFGPDVKIILTGISMGAATVMMALGEELPKNVVCVLADCGYSSPKEIIKKVMVDMKLPADLLYPFVKLGAKLFGRFDLEEISPMEGVRRAKIPVIFIHGEADGFVPCDMSRSLYESCASQKKLLTVPDAGHGTAYLKDGEAYLTALRDFERECGFLNS